MEVQRKITSSVAQTSSTSAAPPPPPLEDDAMSLESLAPPATADTLTKATTTKQTTSASSTSSTSSSAASTGMSRLDIDGAARGDQGPGVQSLQEQLNALHAQPRLVGDGDFGPRTEVALKAFQSAHGLPPTGVVDDATRTAIDDGMRSGFSALPEPPPTRAGLSTGQPRLKGELGGVPVLDQNKLPVGHLGESSTASLRGQGCVLTSFAMVASKLTGEPQDPAALNDKLKDAGAFVDGTGMLNVSKAAAVLGLESSAVDSHAPGALAGVDSALRRGEPVMVRVDYKNDAKGDHTIVLTGRNPDGSYSGIDPAGGRAVTMRPDADGNLVGEGWQHYKATAYTMVSPSSDFEM